MKFTSWPDAWSATACFVSPPRLSTVAGFSGMSDAVSVLHDVEIIVGQFEVLAWLPYCSVAHCGEPCCCCGSAAAVDNAQTRLLKT